MPQFTPGEIIINGKYRIEKLLGAGAFGEVYLATHLNLNALRALKVLRKEEGRGSSVYGGVRRRFLQESELGAMLGSHPHIVQVLDFDEVENVMVLALEYAPGGSLAEKLAQVRAAGQLLEVAETVRIAAQVAEGLAALHRLDVVHRDVKPGNILFTKSGQAKLADLGLAQVPHGLSMRSQFSQPSPHPGTPGYMSPEQCTPPYDTLTPASDVYGLGVVLFEMLTGRACHLQKPGTPPSALRENVPEWLDELVLRMLSNNPTERAWDGVEAARLLGEARTRLTTESRETVHIKPIAPAEDGGNACPICGDYVELKDTFRCKGCGRERICRTHRDAVTYLCEECERLRRGAEEKVHKEAEDKARESARLAAEETAQREVEERTHPLRQQGDRLWLKLSDGVDMEFVRVPAGKFRMGSKDGESNEKPVRTVHLDDYWLGRYPVTNLQYAVFVQANGWQPPEHWPGGKIPVGKNKHPVVRVSYPDAVAFCEWLGRQVAQRIALPTEAQWEKAARGVDGKIYPWGSQGPGGFLCNYNQMVGDTTPVGKFSPRGDSTYSCADMAGNVWEWCADWYGPYPPGEQVNPNGPAKGDRRVLRGGSWINHEYNLRSSNRSWDYPDFRTFNYGFRCALSLP